MAQWFLVLIGDFVDTPPTCDWWLLGYTSSCTNVVTIEVRMREEEMETAIKVVVVGNGAVGKSSMIQRYCKGIFTKDYKKTIGVDFLERQIE